MVTSRTKCEGVDESSRRMSDRRGKIKRAASQHQNGKSSNSTSMKYQSTDECYNGNNIDDASQQTKKRPSNSNDNTKPNRRGKKRADSNNLQTRKSSKSHKKFSKKCQSTDQTYDKCNDNNKIKSNLFLRWSNPSKPIEIQSEENLLPLLLKYAQRERGMMRAHHYRRVSSIRDACRENNIGLDQALSLRRTHMMFLNPQFNDLSKLHLGRKEEIRHSAALFEDAIGQFLSNQGIPFFSEEEQKAMVDKSQKTPPTPDFLLKTPVSLSCCDDVPIHWIEAKMFYAASTIPDGSKNAVGALQRTARRYVATYGPGAFVFSFGFGIRIKTMLEAEGAVVLDAAPLDLRGMREHQRSWCGNDRGHILP